MSTWFNVLPEAILSIAATLLLIVSTLASTPAMRDLLRWLSVFAVVASGVALVYVSGSFGLSADGWLNATSFTTAVALVLLSLIGWAILASPVPGEYAGEWFALLLFAALGSIILARVANLPGVFLGIEVLSISLYIMVAFRYTSRNSLKGGAMYLVLAGVGSAFLVFGMALIYAMYGTMSVPELAVLSRSGALPLVAALGYGMFLVGVGFKLAAVPFHMWAPDVYEAAPASAAGVIASASKGATIAALLPFAFLLKSHFLVIALLCGASMIIGNLLGLRETRVKRILAYSSIAHVGYILLGFLAINPETPLSLPANINPDGAIVFYIVVYGLSALGAFAVLGMLRGDNIVTLNDLHGLGRTQPVAAACMLVFVVSLAGLPISVGFWGKLYLFSAAFNAGLVKLAILGLIGSAIGLFYYLRIIVHLFMVSPEMNPRGVVPVTSGFQKSVLVASASAVVIFSVFPDWLYLLIRGFK